MIGAVARGLLLFGAAIAGLDAQTPTSPTRILLDEAHHNLYAAAAGGYRSFVRLVTEEGFVVTTNRSPFSARGRATPDILLGVTPTGAAAGARVDARARAAFTDAEMDAVQEWVEGGGALLLVTDHYPTGAAAGALARRFGVGLSAGWTDDPAHRRTLPTYGPVFGYLLFSRANGLIGAHPITDGRDASERLRAVTTTTGESIEGPPASTALLRLSATAVDWVPPATGTREPAAGGARDFNPCPTCATRPAGGRSQAIAFEFGRGRVVVVGEMGVLTDYSVREADNRRFTLNIVRWLAREL
jgi:hypothetical protein